VWQKCLIKESRFNTLILKEVWGWVSNPQTLTVGKQQVKFFIINCQASGEPAPLGLAEHELLWLLRNEQDLREDQPPLVSAAQWSHPAWPGL
jgi:hypothetical protein